MEVIILIVLTKFVNAKDMNYGSIEPSYQIAKKGQRVTITCHTHKSPTWSKNGVLILDYRQGSMNFVIEKAKEFDNGLYNCHGYYTNGVAFDIVAELHVGSK